MADEPELAEGAESEWVTHLQNWLQSLGFYNGTIDTNFGPVTAEAVAQAQQQYGINENGTVGRETWALVEQARAVSEGSKAQVVWEDSQVNQVEVPEIGSEEATA